MAKRTKRTYSDNCDREILLSYIFKRQTCFCCTHEKDVEKLLFHKKLMRVVEPSGHYLLNDLQFIHKDCNREWVKLLDFTK